ncbi:hypothetical protein PHLGIDRAFT_504974 [Phlebiopsis gigantea 11061_1 CR5-6]|uniref:C2H2-type domain-containing protein n=1 Tax=Phlebiopsis gigantea (strain 11061_1 CR5-6) TaxID=745531 RepID=A0A0C3S2B7_PHLG1|nr:hypothetical protein PHLGIDRAFT_504974 [Phlebiopsis gigantea 11061_1 CR5-6]
MVRTRATANQSATDHEISLPQAKENIAPYPPAVQATSANVTAQASAQTARRTRSSTGSLPKPGGRPQPTVGSPRRKIRSSTSTRVLTRRSQTVATHTGRHRKTHRAASTDAETEVKLEKKKSTGSCPFCAQVLYGKIYDLIRHVKRHHWSWNQQYQCKYEHPECTYATVQQNNFSLHIKTHHSPESDGEISCKVLFEEGQDGTVSWACAKRFRTLSSLYSHRRREHGWKTENADGHAQRVYDGSPEDVNYCELKHFVGAHKRFPALGLTKGFRPDSQGPREFFDADTVQKAIDDLRANGTPTTTTSRADSLERAEYESDDDLDGDDGEDYEADPSCGSLQGGDHSGAFDHGLLGQASSAGSPSAAAAFVAPAVQNYDTHSRTTSEESSRYWPAPSSEEGPTADTPSEPEHCVLSSASSQGPYYQLSPGVAALLSASVSRSAPQNSSTLEPQAYDPSPVAEQRFYTQSGLELPSLQNQVSQERTTLATPGSSSLGHSSVFATANELRPRAHSGLYRTATDYVASHEQLHAERTSTASSGSFATVLGRDAYHTAPSTYADHPTLQHIDPSSGLSAIDAYYAGIYTWPPVPPPSQYAGYAGQNSTGAAMRVGAPYHESAFGQMMRERRGGD